MNKVILKSEMLAESKLEFKINCEIIKKCVEKESYIVDLPIIRYVKNSQMIIFHCKLLLMSLIGFVIQR